MDNHILVGLGGTGGKILREFKMRMFEEYPNRAERERLPIALLYVDTTREMMGLGRPDFNVMGEDAGFAENEFLNIRSVDVSQIIDNIDNYPKLRGIVDNVKAVKTAIGNLGEAAGQKRRAGRLLFAVNAGRYVQALQNSYAHCHAVNNESSKVVHIFAGLSGGTGSGSIIDAIAQTRKLWNDAKILVYAMIPERDLPKPGMDKGRYYPNAYAALRELNALQCGAFRPHDVTGDGVPMDYFSLNAAAKGVANGICVYSNVNENGCTVNSLEELPRIVSDYAYARIFLINPKQPGCEDIIRAYNFENLDGFELENDETVNPDTLGEDEEIRKARTRKVSSFSIKRVVYPELRVLKHITYTVGESVLNQFKFNNWTENKGFINESPNKDYRGLYLTKDNLERWKIDLDHVTLEKQVLPSDSTHDNFLQDWKNSIDELAEPCRQDKCPPTALSNSMNEIFDSSFRDVGVAEYYAGKSRAMKEIALEMRRGLEKELYDQWRNGDISITDLSKIAAVVAEYIATDLKAKIDEEITKNDEELKASNDELGALLDDWGSTSLVMGALGKKNNIYAKYRAELVYSMLARTREIALAFARALQQVLNRVFTGLVADVTEFSMMVTEAIDRTRELVTAQRKTNPGLEDIRGAIVEVSEDESMGHFEDAFVHDRPAMRSTSQQLRDTITEGIDFINFGDLKQRINVESIINAFDVKLSSIVKARHQDLPVTETKVLDLNILTQLQQKLDSDQKINEFARDMLRQSGPYVDIDAGQIAFQVRNNDTAVEGTNINLKECFISLPSPGDNDSLVTFANKLKNAFISMAPNGVNPPKVNMGSSRNNEFYIMSINSGYPFRALKWLRQDKQRYERFLKTGNEITDRTNAILLHSEGLGKDLPKIFAYSESECRKMDEENARKPSTPSPSTSGSVPPMPPTGATPPPPEQPWQLYLYISGQQYGPYDRNICQQLVTTGQLTQQTPVWEQGMAAWTPAGQIEKVKVLFAPAMPPMPGMPPMPPTGGATPPPMM